MIDLTLLGRLPSGIRAADISLMVERTFSVARKKPQGALCIAFVSETEIAKMNRRFRSVRHATDVLSFPAPALPLARGAVRDWGDLLLAPVYIRREAKRRAISFQEEVARDIVHGILHLFGFDHRTASEELRMFSLQERIVADTHDV